MDTKKTLPLIIAAIILAVAVIYFTRSGGNNSLSPSDSQLISPAPSISASPSADSTGSPQASSGPNGPTPTPVSYVIPRCWLSGEIVFDGKAFMHTGTQEFNYENIYDPHDIIKWQISPSGETFSIGPNRFSGLEPIKGSDYLTVSFNDSAPKYNKYELSASIDYVAVVNNAAKILNEKCSGKTTLIINK